MSWKFFNPSIETRLIKFKPKDKNVAPVTIGLRPSSVFWSSAPSLHNTMLGNSRRPSVPAGWELSTMRWKEKMLWPEKAAE